ncbi:chitobiase/beta-hexosaminidase C-terminal domain-containing protein [uncultured Methanobrevibacter sp.]|uniref:chitobiase/beta-hexosaminidase C-terminal domain-containing protein n=1 Tax=uncultured Methanobrevibacter sp. TaxID=253161 RepID=UPI0026179CFF|nr:chitobiase/beta-hexosaminidase C-terminal domain-containing protein [uncultured Methanobrevibacter sp.]
MDINKKYLIFILILISFASIGAVSADAIDNVTSVDGDIALDEALMEDDSPQNQLSQNMADSKDYMSAEDNINVISGNFSSTSLDLAEGTYQLVNCSMSDVNLTVENAVVNITNSNFYNGNILISGGSVIIANSIFTASPITQTDGSLDLTGNIITKSTVGVNVTGGLTRMNFNSLYDNDIGLVYGSADILYDDNWWGMNNPIYNYSSDIISCDVLQNNGKKSPFRSWLVLSISQSNFLDYDYWIAGVTYYNLTADLTCNNLGEDTSSRGHVMDLELTLTNVKSYTYPNRKGEIKVFTEISSQNCSISSGKGECIFSLGYLTSDLTKLDIEVLGQNYTVNLSSNVDKPNIAYITPSQTFDDTLTVEIKSNGTGEVIFYTLDGTNPAYSPTRSIYTEPITLNDSTTLHYTVIDRWGNFQKVLIDSIFNQGTHTFIKQDCYVELVPHHPLASRGIYYSLDGTTREINADVDSYMYYDHPLVIQDPTEIYFFYYGRVIINDWPLIEGYPISINTYTLDFSTNYIKNSTFAENDAIWGQYQGNVNNTGVTVYNGPLFNQSSWSNDNIASFGSAVIDSEGRIFVAGNDGYLYCLNNQGIVVWRFGTTSKIICTPTIGPDGNIYFSNWMDSIAYCISPDGKLMWKHYLGDYNTGTSPVFGLDNRLYIMSSNSVYSTLYVFKDGKLISNHTIPFISGSTPAVAQDGSLYMVSADHELVIINFDGSLRNATFIDTGYLNRVISNTQNTQISVTLGDDGIVYVINRIRSYLTESFSTVAGGRHAQGTVYYYYAVNAFYLNGTMKWTMTRNVTELVSEFRETVSGAPSYYKGVLYITGNDNLIAVNASNGKFLWMKEIAHSDSTASSPLISANEILYVTSANRVYAFSLNGDLIWQYKIRDAPVSYSSPVLDDSGTLIVTTDRGIYAFNDIAADFTYAHVEGTETTIQFTDLSTKGNNRYYWTFGDGHVSREQNPIHAYAKEGKYRVVLLVEINGTLTVARNTTIDVIFYDITPPSNVTAYIDANLTEGGVFNQTQYVTLKASDDSGSVTIFYTTDGSNPVLSKTRKIYAGPIEIEIYTVFRAVAVDASLHYGNVSSMIFNITDVLNVSTETDSVAEIQKILDTAEPGSKVFFDYGALKGVSFTVNRPLNLISNANTKLYGADGRPIFTFTQNASGSILNGFNIYNTAGEGILINNTSNITVINSYVDTFRHTGINIHESYHINVMDTKVVHASNGILVNESSNTNIDAVTVSGCYDNGVWILNSQNTILSNSLLELNGMYQYSSRANQVLIDNSSYTVVIGNRINYGFFAVTLVNTNYGVIIDNNTIYKGLGDAIVLANNYTNVRITNNLIDDSYNGINFMGYGQDILIHQNTIRNIHGHDDGLNYAFENKLRPREMVGFVYETVILENMMGGGYNGIQVSYPAINFDEGNTVIIDNVIIKLSSFEWFDSPYWYRISPDSVSYIYNLIDRAAYYNVFYDNIRYNQVSTDIKIDTGKYVPDRIGLAIDMIDDFSYGLRLINLIGINLIYEVPSFDVTFRSGSSSKTIKFKNDSAIATFDAIAAVSNVEVIKSAGIMNVAHFEMDIFEGFTSTNRDHDIVFEEGEAFNNPNPAVVTIPDEEMDSDSEDDEDSSHLSQNTTDFYTVTLSNGFSPVKGLGEGNGQGFNNESFNGGFAIFSNNNNNNSKTTDFIGNANDVLGVDDISSDKGSSDTLKGSQGSGMVGFESEGEISKAIEEEDNTFNLILILSFYPAWQWPMSMKDGGVMQYEF